MDGQPVSGERTQRVMDPAEPQLMNEDGAVGQKGSKNQESFLERTVIFLGSVSGAGDKVMTGGVTYT